MLLWWLLWLRRCIFGPLVAWRSKAYIRGMTLCCTAYCTALWLYRPSAWCKRISHRPHVTIYYIKVCLRVLCHGCCTAHPMTCQHVSEPQFVCSRLYRFITSQWFFWVFFPKFWLSFLLRSDRLLKRKVVWEIIWTFSTFQLRFTAPETSLKPVWSFDLSIFVAPRLHFSNVAALPESCFGKWDVKLTENIDLQ